MKTIRRKLLRGIIILTAMLTVIPSALPFCAKAVNDDISTLIESGISWKCDKSGVSSLNELIGTLAIQPGSLSDWYVVALSRYYEQSLDFSPYLNSGYTPTGNATEKQRAAIAFICAGGVLENPESIVETTAGNLGIMSYSYGLILLDCAGIESKMRSEIIDRILSLRLSDGGWSIRGNSSDVDVTAMTVTALSPYYSDPQISAALDSALNLLSKRQQNDGTFSSFHTKNCESTAQVLMALCSLGVCPQSDNRFIKNGNSVLDGLLAFRLSDGSFSHTLSGTSNDITSVQALYSLVALWRFQKGKSPLFKTSSRTFSLTVSSASSDRPVSASAPSDYSQSAEDCPSETPETVQNESISSQNPDSSVPSSVSTESGQVSSELAEELPNTEEKSDFNYKIIVYILLIVFLAAGLFYLKRTGKLGRKNLIVLLCLFLVLCLAAIPLQIQTPTQYYQTWDESISEKSSSVTLGIRCDTIAEFSEISYIPQDGCILENTEIPLEEGDSVFDVLEKAARFQNIQFEYKGSRDSAYISGIQYIYEFAFGELSGWMYSVNGVSPSVGCSEYILSDGDRILWVYSLDLGVDVGLTNAGGV